MFNKHNNFPSATLVSFSSTAKLAANEIKPPVDKTVSAKVENSIKSDGQNPSENLRHPTSTTGAFIHLLKGSLGTGILAMPNAFKNGGLAFGFVGTFVIGIICTYSVHILVKTSQEICDLTKTPSLGFSETSEAAFLHGPKQTKKFSFLAKWFVEISLVFTYFMTSCVYIVFIAESIKQLIDHWIPGNYLNIYSLMILVMAFLLVTTQIRELKHLVVFSFFANIFMVISFVITLYYMFIDIPKIEERNMIFTNILQFPIFFSTVIFGMEGIGTVLPIKNNMSHPHHFLGCPGVLNVAMSVVIALFSVIGFFGYLKYGDSTKATITLNLPVEEIPAQIVKLLIAISVFFTYNLQTYTPLEILWTIVKPCANSTFKRHFYQILMRTAFVVSSTLIAIAIPDLEPIIGLVGSVCLSLLGLMIPSVTETIWRWDGRLGVFKWVLWKNVILCIFAFFAAVSGSFVSIQHIIEKSSKR